MSTITTPARSLEQRRAGLKLANDIRTRRAQLKREMKAGRKSASQIIADPPEWAETMKVFDLLVAVPLCGGVMVTKAMWRAQVPAGKTIGGISPRQRQELLRWLHGR